MSAVLADVLAVDLAVIFCGINPGTTAAKSGHHFSSASNRFWRVMHLAGFTPEQIVPQNDRTLLRFGCGLTTVVPRATTRAAELDANEFLLAAPSLKRRIEKYRPRKIAFLGKLAYSAIVAKREIPWGLQDVRFAGAAAWVVPNPSGLNRNFSLEQLVAAYRELRVAP